MYRYLFVNLSPLLIKCYWILARLSIPVKALKIFPPLYKSLCSSKREALPCEGCFSQLSPGLLTLEVQQSSASTAACVLTASATRAKGSITLILCVEYSYSSIDSVLNLIRSVTKKKQASVFLFNSSIFTDYAESKIKFGSSGSGSKPDRCLVVLLYSALVMLKKINI